MKADIITIDGPAGTGKTTSAAGVAEKLGFLYVDSGALYRAIALAVVRAPEDCNIPSLLSSTDISAAAKRDGFRVFLNGEDVSEEIRTPRVTQMSSVLATRKDVRDTVVEVLRELARESPIPLVVEGRDIGTVVFPDAFLKIYMVANQRERARRRLKDLENKDIQCSLDDVERELAQRDERDSGRELAPLARHPEAVLVDTTKLTISEQIQKIVEAYRERKVSSG